MNPPDRQRLIDINNNLIDWKLISLTRALLIMRRYDDLSQKQDKVKK